MDTYFSKPRFACFEKTVIHDVIRTGTMDEFEIARRKYKPEEIRCLLVAEAPPARGSKRFFYFEDVSDKDTLYLEIMKVLYPDLGADVGRMRREKREILGRFRNDGFYLIDACQEPMPDTKPSTKRSSLRDSLDQLQKNLTETINSTVPVILISKWVYEICREPLIADGWKVLNSEMIEFPGSGQQKKFRLKFRLLISANGWSKT